MKASLELYSLGVNPQIICVSKSFTSVSEALSNSFFVSRLSRGFLITKNTAMVGINITANRGSILNTLVKPPLVCDDCRCAPRGPRLTESAV